MRRVFITWVVVLCVSVGPAAAFAGNEIPLADAGLDQTVEQGTTVVLDATGSLDPDGRITSYEWTIETPQGRVITPAEPTQPRTTFKVTEPGRYRVSVVVRDDDGASTKDTLYVTVDRNDAPEPTRDPTNPPNGSNGTDSGTTGDTDDIRENNVEASIDDRGNRKSPSRANAKVEVVRYEAEDIDFDVTSGHHEVNNNKPAGASGSKTVDHTPVDRLVNAGTVFVRGVKELVFGRERPSYSFTTTRSVPEQMNSIMITQVKTSSDIFGNNTNNTERHQSPDELERI